jgi:hypothetical protein
MSHQNFPPSPYCKALPNLPSLPSIGSEVLSKGTPPLLLDSCRCGREQGHHLRRRLQVLLATRLWLHRDLLLLLSPVLSSVDGGIRHLRHDLLTELQFELTG